MVILEVSPSKRRTMAIESSSDDENMADHAGAPVVLDLQEALGVTPTGHCSRHPNCPVLSLVHNKVMSCRVCFSEEKSVGIRQRKSFAAVVQQLSKQQQTEPEDDEKEGGKGNDDTTPSRKIKRAHSASMQALILQQPQTMESIMKRLGQVQNWMLRQKEKEVMSLQLHIQRLEQRLHDTEVQNQEQKQTIWALRRTIQQDLKIIKTMAVQHEREQLENGSRCGGGGGGGLGWGSSHRSVGDGSASTGMDLRSPKFSLDTVSLSSRSPKFALDTVSLSSAENTPSASPMKLLPPLPGESPQSGTNSTASSRKKGQIVDKYRMSGLRAYTSSGSLAPQQSLRSLMEKSGDQSGGGYLNKDIFVEHQRSSYWNDEEVDRLSTNPSKMFASFRGGLLDIPKSPPKARHDNGNRQKLQLNADDLAQLKMPRMRGVGRTWSHASAASAMSNDDGSIASSFGGLGGAPTLLSLPMSIGETSPEPAEVLFEDPESSAEAAETRKAAMPPPPLNSPSPQNAKLPSRKASSHTDELDATLLETGKDAAPQQQDNTVEKGKVNTKLTTDKAVPTATCSSTSLYSQQSSTTFASGYDQRSQTTGSVSVAEEGETGDSSQAGTMPSKAEGGADEQGQEGLLFEVTGGHCQDNFGDTGMYVGTILVAKGMPHGEGTMTYDSGRVYSGNWVCGQWHGKGKLLNPNGDKYEGDFIFDARHGKGVYKWDNGDVYTGDFKEDKRNGHGKFCFHNGNVYEGEFRDGMFEGFGRYDFEEGSYEGEWVEGRYHGEGTLTYASGGKYTGEFRDSLAHGFGLEVLPDGSKRRGMWEAGQPTQNFASKP